MKRAEPFSSRYVRREKPTRTLRRFWQGLQRPISLGINVSKRQTVGIIAIGFLSFLLVGNLVYHSSIVPSVYADFSTEAHTRSAIWSYKNSLSSVWNFNSTCASFGGNKAFLNYTTGFPINTSFNIDAYSTANQDGLVTLNAQGAGVSQSFDSKAADFYSVQWQMKKVGSPTGTGQAIIYTISGTHGTSAVPNALVIGTAGFDLSTLTTSLVLYEILFVVPLTRSQSPAQLAVTFELVSATVDGSNYVQLGEDGSAPTHAGNIATKANGASAWVANSAFDMVFAVNGRRSDQGANCASADIILSKQPYNLQTVSAKQFELIWFWSFSDSDPSQANTAAKWFRIYLRTNGTLPGFGEAYNPENDKNVRAVFEVCPQSDSSACGATATYTVSIVNDQTKSLSEEGFEKNKVLSMNLATSGHQAYHLAVLNFTSGTNYGYSSLLSGASSTTTSNTVASGLQQGIDYYLGIQILYNTALNPTTVSNKWYFGFNQVPTGVCSTCVESFQAFSVPPRCSDPKNNCNFPTPQPTFDINPFDPSSWANAIIKGLVWAATEALRALSFVLGMIADVFVTAMDALGNFFGFGAMGTAIRSFFTGIISWINSVFGTVLGQALNEVNAVISILSSLSAIATDYFAGLTGWLAAVASIWASIIQVIKDTFGFVGFGWKAFLVAWFAYGTLLAFRSFDAWMGWCRQGYNITMSVLSFIWWLSETVWALPAKIKGLLHPTAAGGAPTSPPPSASGGTTSK